jgi:hypothetical protein
MPVLSEPRCFAAMTIDPLSGLAAQVAHAADVTQRGRLLNRLHNEVREALASGRDDLLRHATANVISPVAGWILLDALDHVINTPAVASSARAVRCGACVPRRENRKPKLLLLNQGRSAYVWFRASSLNGLKPIAGSWMRSTISPTSQPVSSACSRTAV